MIDYQKRGDFIDYLNKLINEPYNKDDWFNYIIEHYPDEELEEIRRKIVRLRIAAGDPEIFPVTEEHREKLKEWIDELQVA
ncbi:hypothetical protein Bpfe_031559 [Biomphalaria pfeifferi]|uniref:Uncharacterized protein n=1 Tax=Biomphalaria pfeifferi TaxID=112525 RepID=A0AAD8EST8_BIOPF|nr:hypothetical protein Bpfe_031559 [Biomphalaria pfeifferi]